MAMLTFKICLKNKINQHVLGRFLDIFYQHMKSPPKFDEDQDNVLLFLASSKLNFKRLVLTKTQIVSIDSLGAGRQKNDYNLAKGFRLKYG
jgi:hypothetical protein